MEILVRSVRIVCVCRYVFGKEISSINWKGVSLFPFNKMLVSDLILRLNANFLAAIIIENLHRLGKCCSIWFKLPFSKWLSDLNHCYIEIEIISYILIHFETGSIFLENFVISHFLIQRSILHSQRKMIFIVVKKTIICFYLFTIYFSS